MNAKHKLREAVDSLYSLGRATSDVYTRLVLDCVRFNDVYQAKRLQSHMDLHFYEPTTTFLHNRLLHLHVKSGQLSDARKVFDRMPERDVITYNAMLSAYSKMGSVVDLRTFFDQIPRLNTVSYNTLIAGLVSKGCSREALEIFITMQREGFEPTDYTLVNVLNACSQVLDLERGKQVHGRILLLNLSGNAFIWNALTDLYAKCGQIYVARWLFNQMANKSVVSWNLMISGYLKNRQPESCIALFREMQFSGLKPDQITISNILGALIQIGQIDEAQKLFEEIKEKDTVCWTTMIVGQVQNGNEEVALALFGEMLAKGVKPDGFTISSVVSSCARLASLYHGQVVHGKAVHMGVDGDTLVSSALVDMYSKCGETADSWNIFSMMPTKNVVTWNSMIFGYTQNGKNLRALELYEEMLNHHLKPDNITLVGVLSACTHEGSTERGQEYFHSMKQKHGMTPTLDHYACMINLLGHSGCIDKAIALVKEMPHEPNNLIWSTLLNICKANGDIKQAEMVAKHLFEVDPLNAEPYIIMSNLYAGSGRWKDMASMRSLMENRKVKKFAAYSWMEIDGAVHKFIAEDRAHPESETIYRELNGLIKKLRESGFIPNKSLVLHDVGEDEKFESICYHSEKLALAYWLTRKPLGVQPIRIMKNIRVCGDCHVFMKFVSRIIGRSIILRDSNRFHHFTEGICSCKDLW